MHDPFGLNVCGHFQGFNLVKSRTMRDPITEKRTWKERLFSLPWKPFTKTKVVGWKPMDTMYRIENYIFGAPETIDKLIQLAEKSQ